MAKTVRPPHTNLHTLHFHYAVLGFLFPAPDNGQGTSSTAKTAVVGNRRMQADSTLQAIDFTCPGPARISLRKGGSMLTWWLNSKDAIDAGKT